MKKMTMKTAKKKTMKSTGKERMKKLERKKDKKRKRAAASRLGVACVLLSPLLRELRERTSPLQTRKHLQKKRESQPAKAQKKHKKIDSRML
ncbi:hypothetical protein TGPRC2_425470, partial [Toxoplasma gondii TgCatPRC2]